MYKIFDTVDEVSKYTAQRIMKKIQAKPNTILGLATGGTMEPVYAKLLELISQTSLDLSKLTTFNLDEYIGLSANHPQSYNYYMYEHLFNNLNIPKQRVNLPDGMAENVEEECKKYSKAIQDIGGLDLQLLGIGSNGHIGFNEPHTSFSSRTHVIELTRQTRIDNGRFFKNKKEVPTHAITLGILDILEAKEIILVATGSNKAEIMAKLFHSPIDEALPASALKQHKNLTIVLDSKAAALYPENI
ncbi:MAG: glucosamine-6-phosphate deaminase [Desulforegulaceae bacterium]|nr:glucosamine-6-phosphate deaminase [Desulforegulaceae bacterium]